MARFGETTKLARPAAKPVLPDKVLADYRFLECREQQPADGSLENANAGRNARSASSFFTGSAARMSPSSRNR